MDNTRDAGSDVRDRGSERMPVLFIGHGSPMNAIEDNIFSKKWREVGRALPVPEAILCISAHWETRGSAVTAMERPETIHDFGGFPLELYDEQYPAPGSAKLAQETRAALKGMGVSMNMDWGLDHGAWSVLKHLFPDADVPVVQLSLDYTKEGAVHYEIGKKLAPLRDKKILIIGSGNMVHNLGRLVLKNRSMSDLNEPFGLDWAIEASDLFKKLIDEERHSELADYLSLGDAVKLAVPTPEHFLPLLYILALKEQGETVTYFNDVAVGGSLTMTSIIIDS